MCTENACPYNLSGRSIYLYKKYVQRTCNYTKDDVVRKNRLTMIISL
uniref:Uncharacterized protein n=1 Tax=Arundo donax TaxID=35708 RepID=A0A0A9EEM5_ARUDO